MLYVFVGNSALDWVDPDGLLKQKVYGEYCGPHWCGGEFQSEKDCACSIEPLPDPKDEMDKCCFNHDMCLGKGGGKECDEAMCKCLQAVEPALLDPPPGKDLNWVKKQWQLMIGTFCPKGYGPPWH